MVDSSKLVGSEVSSSCALNNGLLHSKNWVDSGDHSFSAQSGSCVFKHHFHSAAYINIVDDGGLSSSVCVRRGGVSKAWVGDHSFSEWRSWGIVCGDLADWSLALANNGCVSNWREVGCRSQHSGWTVGNNCASDWRQWSVISGHMSGWGSDVSGRCGACCVGYRNVQRSKFVFNWSNSAWRVSSGLHVSRRTDNVSGSCCVDL